MTSPFHKKLQERSRGRQLEKIVFDHPPIVEFVGQPLEVWMRRDLDTGVQHALAVQAQMKIGTMLAEMIQTGELDPTAMMADSEIDEKLMQHYLEDPDNQREARDRTIYDVFLNKDGTRMFQHIDGVHYSLHESMEMIRGIPHEIINIFGQVIDERYAGNDILESLSTEDDEVSEKAEKKSEEKQSEDG